MNIDDRSVIIVCDENCPGAKDRNRVEPLSQRRKIFLGMGLGRGIRIVWVDIFRGRREGEIDDVDHGGRIFVENANCGRI